MVNSYVYLGTHRMNDIIQKHFKTFSKMSNLDDEYEEENENYKTTSFTCDLQCILSKHYYRLNRLIIKIFFRQLSYIEKKSC